VFFDARGWGGRSSQGRRGGGVGGGMGEGDPNGPFDRAVGVGAGGAWPPSRPALGPAKPREEGGLSWTCPYAKFFG